MPPPGHGGELTSTSATVSTPACASLARLAQPTPGSASTPRPCGSGRQRRYQGRRWHGVNFKVLLTRHPTACCSPAGLPFNPLHLQVPCRLLLRHRQLPVGLGVFRGDAGQQQVGADARRRGAARLRLYLGADGGSDSARVSQPCQARERRRRGMVMAGGWRSGQAQRGSPIRNAGKRAGGQAAYPSHPCTPHHSSAAGWPTCGAAGCGTPARPAWWRRGEGIQSWGPAQGRAGTARQRPRSRQAAVRCPRPRARSPSR